MAMTPLLVTKLALPVTALRGLDETGLHNLARGKQAEQAARQRGRLFG